MSDKTRATYHHGIEQARRDFKAAQPELYAYIAAHEVARALDSAGDTLSGASSGAQAASRLWRLSARVNENKRRIQSEADQ